MLRNLSVFTPSRRLLLAALSAFSLLTAAHAAPPAGPVFNKIAGAPFAAGDGADDIEARCDYDGDGNLDLLTCDRFSTGHAVRIRRGLAGGTFAATTTDFPFGTEEPTSLGVGALTGGDNRPDIAVAVGGTIRILSNTQGNGGAISLAQTATLSMAGIEFKEVKVADLNGDGLSDVIATGTGKDENQFIVGRLVVFLNSPTGFDAGTMALGRESSLGRFAIGDLDQDGKLDIIAVNKDEYCISVYLATAPGVFGALPVRNSVEFEDVPMAVAIGQVSGDAAPEVVVWKHVPIPNNQYIIGVTGYGHTGDGVLQFKFGLGVSSHPNTFQTGDVWIADVNHDGQNDIVFTDPISNNIVTLTFNLKGDGTVDTSQTGLRFTFTPTSNTPKRISLANLNKDTVVVGGVTLPKLDLVTVNNSIATGRAVDVFLNGAGGTTPPPITSLPKPTLTVLKPTIGPWRFSVTTPTAVPSDAFVKIQYTTTPNDENSWVDLPNGTLSATSATNKAFKLDTQSLPLGNVTFRAVVHPSGASTLEPGVSVASKAYPIARKLDSTIAQVLTVSPLKLAAAKGQSVTYDGTNIDKVTKKVDGDQGEFVYFGLAVLNKGDVSDNVQIQGPSSASGFLISYFEPSIVGTSVSLTDVTSEVTDGIYYKSLGRGEPYALLMRIRVGATLPVDTLGSWELNVKSAIDASIKDMSRAQIEVTKPADVAFVTTTNDNGDNLNATPGSMRAAIAQAIKNYRKKTTIRFELPASPTSIASVPISTELPPLILAANTVIDGDSQVEYRNAYLGTTIPGPAVELRGAGNATSGVGLSIQTSGCLVRNVQFANFTTGLQIAGKNAQTGLKVSAMGNVIVNCVFEGNLSAGLELKDGAVANQIGDDNGRGNLFASVRNGVGQILGNYGIHIHDDGTDRNRIQGNTIGSSGNNTNLGGDRSYGFNKAGLLISDKAAGNLIGGYHAGERNFIEGNQGGGLSGQTAHGLVITGAGTTANFVQGNTFGELPTGSVRQNKGNNIVIEEGASDNIIGGTTSGMGNKIMGARGNGILIQGSLATGATPTNKNRVEGNQIGGYDEDHENYYSGIVIAGGATNTVIGGEKANAANVILGNGKGDQFGGGIGIVSGGAGTLIQGNYIGVDANNTANGNKQGIITIGGSKVTIGSAKAIGQNVIGKNVGAGILASGLTDSIIIGNRIGVSANGLVDLGNGNSGIVLTNGANRNKVGGLLAGQANIIQKNGARGVVVSGASVQNTIRGNNHGRNTQFIPIDLSGGTEDSVGFTANDPLDADTGANNLQNSPQLTDIDIVAGKTKITGTFSSVPTTGTGANLIRPAYAFDVHADGVFVGTVTFDTDRLGNPTVHGKGEPPAGTGGFSITVPKNLSGKAVTVTATKIEGLDGSTSEMSNFVVIGT